MPRPQSDTEEGLCRWAAYCLPDFVLIMTFDKTIQKELRKLPKLAGIALVCWWGFHPTQWETLDSVKKAKFIRFVLKHVKQKKKKKKIAAADQTMKNARQTEEMDDNLVVVDGETESASSSSSSDEQTTWTDLAKRARETFSFGCSASSMNANAELKD